MEADFLRHARGYQPTLPAGVGLGRALASRVSEGQARWPGIALAEHALLEVWAKKAAQAPGESWLLRLTALQTDSLLLCAGCAQGDPSALAHFERAYFSAVDALGTRLLAKGVSPDELRQAVRERLFVATALGQPPRIASYSGQGELGSWVRVAASRVAALLATRGPREEPRGDLLGQELPLEGHSPELAHLRRLFQDEFRAAFDGAVAERTSRQRTLLRQRFVDGLTVPQLAALHGVHASTVFRWQTEALDALLGALRETLMTRIDVDDRELDSLLLLMRSQLDVTLRRLLSSGERAR